MHEKSCDKPELLADWLGFVYLCRPVRIITMLIIDARESDSLDKALKKYKRKFERTGVLKELRRRKAYRKPSITNRQQRLKAIYKQEKYGNQG